MRAKILSFLLFTLFLGACAVPKDVVYFQGVDELTKEQINLLSRQYEARIQPDDLLSIAVTAPDPTVVTAFNPPATAYAAQGDEQIRSTESMFTYLVNTDGEINFPILGKIKIGGLTKRDAVELLQEKISKYASNPLVDIRILNYKVTILGDVARPGTIGLKNDRISVLDALGLAGDMNLSANRKNVMLIRETNGVKEYARLDFTDTSLFSSPYYFLQQNDVLYVEPNDAKKKNAGYSQSDQFKLTIFTTILSTISVISSIIIATTR
ncbi:polysaccharide biosynthesis/export family protein [Massilibacteroides sp.]|uniref:polysaccharide biosynthesis/export family protein n=1 Tax=Massilibacteroides sp. TaxID=2034766 RepID=UPI002608E4FC|nr:polysaccharide biosynthesis/export family protein [Massilibacteroides sp.]MDD4515322.1 polysaccharide biosynthesis/export family protein [Massilibacteroides sp.]